MQVGIYEFSYPIILVHLTNSNCLVSGVEILACTSQALTFFQTIGLKENVTQYATPYLILWA